jgi:putative lipoic acid-binding regulatory protein
LTNKGDSSIIIVRTRGKEDDTMVLQFTLFCSTGQYKPVSTCIHVESLEDYEANHKEYKERAIKKIAMQRYWDSKDLKKYGYTKLKVRLYHKQDQLEQALNRYNKLRQEIDS